MVVWAKRFRGSTLVAVAVAFAVVLVGAAVVWAPSEALGQVDHSLDRSYWGAANTVVPVYDTAWDMGVQVTLGEGEEYMDFLSDAGFSGFATTYLGAIHRPAVRPDQEDMFVNRDGRGNEVARWDEATGNLIMDPNHADHFEDLLDAAHDRGLRVMLLVFWERKSVEEYGLINEGNAYNWANQIGRRFKDHPAIQTWTLGGDAGTDDARTQLWTNAVRGLRDAGVTGDINFHTGSAPARRVNQVNADWNSAQLVQTSHCAGTELATSRLERVMRETDTPVWVGESRYEGIDATWCDPQVSIPTADDIVADARSFLETGVAGILYGHNERWQWGHGLEGSGGEGWQSVRESFAAPGAFALIDALTVEQPSMPAEPAPIEPVITEVLAEVAEPEPVLCGGERVTVVGSVGTPGDDVIVGTAGADVIRGLGGDDIICGVGGNDTIFAGRGNDVVYGGRGADTIRLGPGNDEAFGQRGRDDIAGGKGNDSLRGNSGNDRLVGGRGDDVARGGRGIDRCTASELERGCE